MRILLIGNDCGGLFSFRYEVLQAMLVTGYEVHVCAPNSPFAKNCMEMGCIYEPCDFKRHGTNPFAELHLIQKYRKILKTVKPDIVFTYTIKPNIYGGMACARAKIPYVANVTGLGIAVENPGLMQKITLTLYRWAFRKAHVVFFQNTGNRDFMLGHHVVKSTYDLLPGSGVNLTAHCYKEYPCSNKEIVFLFVGRIMRDKGIEELLEAAKRLHDKYRFIRFIAVGTYEDDCRRRMEELDAGRYIEFVGEQRNVDEWYAGAHALVHPSYHEGMSNVCLEAAACGRPILASNVPGCRETFDEGVSGFGFKPRDVDSLCEVIEKFIVLPHKKKEEMGRAGRAKMEQEFDRSIVVEKYMEIVREIKGDI